MSLTHRAGRRCDRCGLPTASSGEAAERSPRAATCGGTAGIRQRCHQLEAHRHRRSRKTFPPAGSPLLRMARRCGGLRSERTDLPSRRADDSGAVSRRCPPLARQASHALEAAAADMGPRWADDCHQLGAGLHPPHSTPTSA
jgi:hypothetical protein